MSDSAKEMKPAAVAVSSLAKKERKGRLSGDSGVSNSPILCVPGQDVISVGNVSGVAPLHPPSFSSSSRGDVGSSEVDAASSEVSKHEDESFGKGFILLALLRLVESLMLRYRFFFLP